jgi:hypothetical protein
MRWITVATSSVASVFLRPVDAVALGNDVRVGQLRAGLEVMVSLRFLRKYVLP